MFSTLLTLFVCAVSTLLIQLIGFPLVLTFFGKKTAQPEWWAWGRLVGWLAIGLPLWFGAHLLLPVNTAVGFWAVFVLLLAALYFIFPNRNRQQVRQFLRIHLKQVLLQEALFLFGFLFLGLVRTYHPAVLDLEKFMNAGLMQGYLRSPILPAEDVWLSGKTLNYYSFGQFLASQLLRFWNLPVEVGFNVLLGWIMGLVLVESFSLGQTLLRNFLPRRPFTSRPLFFSGIATALLIVFGGNSHPIWYWLKNKTFAGYWYPDVTRFIEYTIHEIPAYSFVVSDLHAHFLSIPIVLFTLFIIRHWLIHIFLLKESFFKKQLWKNAGIIKLSVVLGGLLGILGMTNTWDTVVYGLFLCVLSGLVFFRFSQKLWILIISAVYIAGAALAVLAPWLLNFSSIVEGVFLVEERSPFWQLLVLWTGHVSFSILAMGVAAAFFSRIKKPDPTFYFLFALGLTGVLLIVLPEIIYFKDIYPTFPRANTMFKFVFQASIMMNLLIGWLLGFLSQNKLFLAKPLRIIFLAMTVLFLAGVLTYPFLGYPAYYDQFKSRTNLDGLTWLRTTQPQEYEAVMWLRSEVYGRPVILEAVGDSYTEYTRIATFSGLPTLIGWRAHQWLWRGGPEIPMNRSEDVKMVYEQPESFEAHKVLETYRVQFIFVGSKERETYELDAEGVKSLGETVFQKGRVFIIKRTL